MNKYQIASYLVSPANLCLKWSGTSLAKQHVNVCCIKMWT